MKTAKISRRHFVRGTDPLDEEEFYAAVGDTASFNEVHGSRSLGEVFQSLGMGLLIAGAAVAIGGLTTYFLSKRTDDDRPGTIPLTDEQRQIPLYGAIAGGVLAAGGGYLLFGTQKKVRGDPMVFSLDHAQASLEKSLYGDNGLSPGDRPSVEAYEGCRKHLRVHCQPSNPCEA